MRTYEPRQGRKAATAVCFVFAVVTLASSPFPQGLLAAKRSGYAVPVNLNSFFRSALIAFLIATVRGAPGDDSSDSSSDGAHGRRHRCTLVIEAEVVAILRRVR